MIARPRDHVVPSDLPRLAEAVAAWADGQPHVWRACIFGSRVRGDHRPGSDLDVLVQPPQAGMSTECLHWWLEAREAPGERFAALRGAVLPVALHLAHALWDPAQGWADSAALNPDSVVLRIRKAVCLWTSRQRGNVVA